MKTEKMEKTRIIWFGFCPYCDKQMKGSNEKQLIYNMNTHITNKHQGKEKVTKTKEETK